MVKLRFKRTGKKNFATYRLVATDSRSPRDGKFIEEIGHFNPKTKEFVVDKELVYKWLQDGAQPSETVKTLLKKHKLYGEYLKDKKAGHKVVKAKKVGKLKKTVKNKTAKKGK